MHLENIDAVPDALAPPVSARSVQARVLAQRLLDGLARLSGANALILRVPALDQSALRLLVSSSIPESQRLRIDLIPGRCGVCKTVMSLPPEARHSETSCQCARVFAESTGIVQKVTALPVKLRDSVTGVLSILRDADHPAPDQEDSILVVLSAAADLLAGALEEAALSDADFHAGLMLQRHLIANEVHDSLAQNLTSIRMRTALLRDALVKNDAGRSCAYLAEIDQSLALAQSRVRELITDFRSQLGATQLVPAIEEEVDNLRRSSTSRIDFINKAREPQLSAFEQVQVFYIAREALTNALKHANPSHVEISLKESEGEFLLCVEDNGSGIELSARTPGAKQGHFGMKIMQERAARIGGRIEFLVPPGGGTCVRLRFPSKSIQTEPSPP